MVVRFWSLVTLIPAAPAFAVPPTPDHVVIVIEENHSFNQVIGSPDAPYINALATAGASFTNMYALTHPSQPNYIQFFSGSHQGVFDNNVPVMLLPFTAPNLGAALLGAGHTFVGYSEDLPSVGYTGSSSGFYRRKHNPWVNWQVDPPTGNQLPSSINKPFFTSDGSPQPFYGDANAPTDYTGLPRVSIVVPNQLNDMHDGTIEMADDWLMAHIKPYADWAVDHNSLLIITWDEDESASRNRIPTIFHGPMIVPGQYPQVWTLHNLLRTVGDMYAATPAGSAQRVRPMVGCFATDPPIATQTFQQGAAGYTGAKDTFLWPASPTSNYSASTVLYADNEPPPPAQILIRFDDLVGVGSLQIPQGAAVLSAKMLMLTGPSSATFDSSIDRMEAHRMLTPWSDSSTWGSLGSGVSIDDVEAASNMEFGVIPNVLDAWAIFDVTDSVQLFVNDPAQNLGWVIHPTGTDGWRCQSSEASQANRPILDVTFDPTSCRATIDVPPIDTHRIAGDALVLTVSASNPNPLTYRWRKNGEYLTDGGPISGVNTSTLTLDPVVPNDTGLYDVVVSNVCGDVTSAAGRVLICPNAPDGDMNGDLLTDGHDIQPFVSALLNDSTAVSDLCPGDFSLNLRMDDSDLAAFIASLTSP
jgi:hypothetical protein